ncbi:hypothetical protein ACQ4M3_11955 [Leptolyngbya sp. AN03gr2]|uniref:hypothetical protein n=1 Tax=unclassified Leptolyngbya TaxID=2650499 RepID=UPI003D315E24
MFLDRFLSKHDRMIFYWTCLSHVPRSIPLKARSYDLLLDLFKPSPSIDSSQSTNDRALLPDHFRLKVNRSCS